MTTKQFIGRYCYYSYSELRDIILSNTSESDEAAYYLLRYKMEDEMSYLYGRFTLKDELGDVLMDFLLYLRNGKAGNNVRPYQGLEGIFSMLAFKAWVKRVYRNFLVDRSNHEKRSGRIDKEYGKDTGNTCEVDNDGQIRMISILIAWMIQETTPNERFLFFRHLLHTMCKVDVIPSARMAAAMGISYGTYRTRDSRINAKMQMLMQKLQGRKHAELTPTLSALANEIYENFDDLTGIIKRQYEQNLENVDNNLRIQEERQQDLAERKWQLEEKAKQEKEWHEECEKIQNLEARKKAELEKAQKVAKQRLAIKDEDAPNVRYSLSINDPDTRYSLRTGQQADPEIRYSVRSISVHYNYSPDLPYVIAIMKVKFPSMSDYEIMGLIKDIYPTMLGNLPVSPKPKGPVLPPKPRFNRKPVSPKEFAKYTKPSILESNADEVLFDFHELSPRSHALKLFKDAYLTE